MSLFIILSLLCFFLLLVFLGRNLFRQNKQITTLQTQLEEQVIWLQSLQNEQQQCCKNITGYQQELTELNYSTKQSVQTLTEKLQSFIKITTVLQNEVEILSKQQPEDKLYSRALKLAALGADLEEISQSCEIPLAEAEMLLAVHQNKVRSVNSK